MTKSNANNNVHIRTKEGIENQRKGLKKIKSTSTTAHDAGPDSYASLATVSIGPASTPFPHPRSDACMQRH